MILYSIESDDCKLQAYASERESEQIVLFLHGGPGSGAKAIYELSAFQALEKDYRCVYFDQRGSGNSAYDLRKGLSIHQICFDVAKVIDDTKRRFKPKQIFLWGGSYGGNLACLYMQTYNKGIDGLILNNPAVFFEPAQALSFFERLANQALKRMPIELQNSREITERQSVVVPREELQKKEFVDFVYSPYNSSKSLKHICAMSDWFFDYFYHTCFEQLAIPTLLLMGKEDQICRNDDTVTAIKKINNPYIEWHVISPCGHAIFEDCPEDFVAYTKNFLHKHKETS